mmetsp:Transcript_6050/g.13220  ORF Transcript_6050/g.13220 Transcript_6050/m.13220 type:complete len:161 (-) Transcript_6050:194-676(-)
MMEMLSQFLVILSPLLSMPSTAVVLPHELEAVTCVPTVEGVDVLDRDIDLDRRVLTDLDLDLDLDRRVRTDLDPDIDLDRRVLTDLDPETDLVDRVSLVPRTGLEEPEFSVVDFWVLLRTDLDRRIVRTALGVLTLLNLSVTIVAASDELLVLTGIMVRE